jgi:DNA repair photolyase
LFIRRFSGHHEAWGEFVDAKVNAPELLKKQLIRAKKGKVWISSVTDPYQPLEKKYGLTRKCLKELTKSQFPVIIQTKSDLVLRDLDLIQEFEDIEVGFTITTDDEGVARLFEPHASPVKQRLKVLETIHAQGIKTFAFLGPLLPGNSEKLIASLEGKTDNILIDRMNYISSIKRFYYQHNLSEATTNRYFYEYKNRLVEELGKRGMNFEVLF